MGSGEEAVLLHIQLVRSVELDSLNITDGAGREQHFTLSPRCRQLLEEKFLAAEHSAQPPHQAAVNGSPELHTRRHGDHSSHLCFYTFTRIQMDLKHGKSTFV
ncbi:hypothetical protein D3C73_841450 [compost metagenome]